MKICCSCKEEKDYYNFYKSSKDGLQSRCKSCAKEYTLLWQKQNKEKVNIKNQKYKKKYKIWLRENNKLYTLTRGARVRKSTPKWANLFFIEEIYLLAKQRTNLLGFSWHVDHIIPIKGKGVCGLHVENNLQVIPAKENMSKGNRY